MQSTGIGLRDALLRGEIDFSIATDRFPDPAIDWTPIWNDELVALVPPGHRLARRKVIEVTELGTDRLITFGPGHAAREAVDELMRRSEFVPNIVFEGEELAMVVGLAGVGFGTALVMNSLEHLRHTAAVLRFKNSPVRTTGLATRKDRELAEPLAAFRSLVLEQSTSR